MLSLRQAYGGKQITIAETLVRSSEVLLKAGKIKKGWAICGVRELTKVTKCNNCLGSEYVAATAKDLINSASSGNTTSTGTTPKKSPRCVFFVEKKNADPKHVT